MKKVITNVVIVTGLTLCVWLCLHNVKGGNGVAACIGDVSRAIEDVSIALEGGIDYPTEISLEPVESLILCASTDPNALSVMPGELSIIPNYAEEVIAETDPIWIELDVEPFTSLTIGLESCEELVLSFEGDELTITGDADMNEAAKIFFYEILKPMADDYIAERLSE